MMIGLLMVAVAAAGYLLLGPNSETARSDHDRPADVATSIPAVTSGISATHTLTDTALTGTEMDTLRTEMEAISTRVNAILATPVPPAASATQLAPPSPVIAPAGE
jgi:hypothetical protein